MKEAFLRITGRVQGVFYRDATREKALKLNLKGYVKNMDDGSVVICVQGAKEDVEDFVSWCHEGPDPAKVDHVEVSWQEPEEDFTSFEITY